MSHVCAESNILTKIPQCPAKRGSAVTPCIKPPQATLAGRNLAFLRAHVPVKFISLQFNNYLLSIQRGARD